MHRLVLMSKSCSFTQRAGLACRKFNTQVRPERSREWQLVVRSSGEGRVLESERLGPPPDRHRPGHPWTV